MKKWTPYMVIAVGMGLLLLLLVFIAQHRPRHMNEHITLRQQDKIPYGTFVAQHLLTGLFPHATISNDKSKPGYWQTLSEDTTHQALILIAKSFNADNDELNRLFDLAKKGNYVFIIANNLSFEANRFFNCTDNYLSYDNFDNDDDSLHVHSEQPPFALVQHSFIYPGKKYESYFTAIDTPKTIVLGRTLQRKVNFIQLNAGAGSIFIHLAPLAFSNYFILHRNNIQYYQNALSVIPANVRKVVWSEYYLSKPAHNVQQEPNLFRILLQYPSFKWALLTAMAFMLLFVLLEMRRKQRIIPAYNKPVNDSLDFVKTIGRLYYERHDHQNLVKKMSLYFSDHVRNRYKLSTEKLDDDFAMALHQKSTYPLADIKDIINFINQSDEYEITDEQLFHFYKQLEQFYQNT